MYNLLEVTQVNQMLPNSIVVPEPKVTKKEPVAGVLNKLYQLKPYLPPALKMTWQIQEHELTTRQPVSLQWLLQHQPQIEKALQKSQLQQQQIQRVLGQIWLIEAYSGPKPNHPPVGF